MKKVLEPAPYPGVVNGWLLALRAGVGAFMLTHGLPKVDKLIGDDVEFVDPFGLGPGITLVLAVLTEFLCSVLIIIGLGTRVAAALLILTMVTAAFIIHADDPFGKKELALLYLLSYGTILALGPGKFSLDHLIGRSRKKSRSKRKTDAVNGVYRQKDRKKAD